MKQKILTKRNKKGQGLVEYSLISSLVGLVVVGALMAFGPEIKVITTSLMDSVSGGYRVVDGNLIPPDQTDPSSPTVIASTPINASTQTPVPSPTTTPTRTTLPTSIASATPINVSSPTPTWTPLVIVSPTPNTLACTPGSAANITSRSACTTLRDINNCENSNYNSRKDTCSWY